MKITAINGSPRGRASNTLVMINALLEKFITDGHFVNCINLADKDLQYCKGCYSCWSKTPGKCVHEDDMENIIKEIEDTHLFIIGTPLYLNNMSGTLKVFFDRLTAVGGNPHKKVDTCTEKINPAYIMVANCGYPIRSQFDIVSLWINRFAQMTQTKVLAEFYTTNGKVLTQPSSEQERSRENYLNFLRSCGQSISKNEVLNVDQKALLERSVLDF